MCMQPVFGALSDRIGRRKQHAALRRLGTLVHGAAPDGARRQRASPLVAFALITLRAGLIVSFYTSISGIVKAELFPAEVRALGVGLSYAVANAMFGGTAEYVALWFKSVGHESTFFWYVTVMMAIAFFASLIMPNPKVHGYLDGAGTVEEALGKKPG